VSKKQTNGDYKQKYRMIEHKQSNWAFNLQNLRALFQKNAHNSGIPNFKVKDGVWIDCVLEKFSLWLWCLCLCLCLCF